MARAPGRSLESAVSEGVCDESCSNRRADALVLPVAILVSAAVRARSFADALAGSGPAIANSLVLAAVGATLVIAVALWLGYASARFGRRPRQLADVTFVALFAVPARSLASA